MRRRRILLLVYLATLTGVLAWLGAIGLAPYLKSRGVPLGRFIYACFSPVCHQIPARSFLAWGYPLAVCARCLGIYSGFLAGMALYPMLRGFSTVRLPKTKNFLAVTVPIAVDTAGNFFRFWATSNVLRLATGFLWGTILPFYLMTGLAELALKDKKQIE
jgi:uncharacterized membrane protein